MSQSPNLALPFLAAAQAQKHVTVNEALRALDALIQIAVESAALSAPPGSPANGQRWIVGATPTGAWAGQADKLAAWQDGAWAFYAPQDGWTAWDRATARSLVYRASPPGWVAAAAIGISDADFLLFDDVDPTKRAVFQLSSISSATTRTYTLPNGTTTLAGLATAQTFSGNQTFSGTVTVSSATATIGTATGAATYGLGTGATTTGNTKTVNVATAGLSGSTTVVNIGSTVSGAGGQMVVNLPDVQFAASVLTINAPAANLSAARIGIGGATADATNRLSVNAPATLLNHAGASHEATVNKAAAGNDAAFAFKTGFSTRALFGLLGSDDFTLKVSPDGSSYFDALVADRSTGRVAFPAPVILPGLAAAPAAPAAGRLALYARNRAGAPWLDVIRPSGRDFPLQPHTGVNRIASALPSSGSTVVNLGLPLTAVGTISTPTLATGSVAATSRRWRNTSTATADSAAEQRGGVLACFRGNVAGQGGFTFIARISLATLQATGMGFFGLLPSTLALATTLTVAGMTNVIGFGFQRGSDTNWQVIHNDGSGAPTKVDCGSGFPVGTDALITILLWAPPNGSSVWARIVNEETGAGFEHEITGDLPAATTFLGARLYLNNGATAAAVAYDCAGIYLETDY
jgi:hypothetical protein